MLDSAHSKSFFIVHARISADPESIPDPKQLIAKMMSHLIHQIITEFASAGGPPADVEAFVEACEDRYFADDVDGEIEVWEDGVVIRVMDEIAGTSDACKVVLDDTWRVCQMILFVETYM